MSGTTAPDPWEQLRRLQLGQQVEIRQPDGTVWRGTLVPAHDLSGPRVIQLKLDSGYNVGVRVGPDDHVTAGPPPAGNGNPSPTPAAGAATAPSPPGGWVAILSTGGTIASRVDYRTGGVRPVRDEREILQFYPNLDHDGPVRITSVFDRLSEDIHPDDWLVLARHAATAFHDGARGVVIPHGTDTLAYTAGALSFLLENLPGPVVLVGAQRSPDRPSSDGFTNIVNAVRLARDPQLAEVVVLMHANLSDERFAIHRGTRVRKMHSSRRDAFESRNGPALGYLEHGTVHWNRPLRPRSTAGLVFHESIDPRGGLLWFHPGLEPERAAAFVGGLRGVILAGTGLGHISSVHLPWVREAVRRGVVLGMTTQCLAGDVDPYVYATGRELLKAGVLYLNDLLPETAYAKLLWSLGRSSEPTEVARLMLEDRAGEFERRHEVEAPE